jgi:hypothetical protein
MVLRWIDHMSLARRQGYVADPARNNAVADNESVPAHLMPGAGHQLQVSLLRVRPRACPGGDK